MNKRALAAVPKPILSDRRKEFRTLVSDTLYLVTVSREEVSGIDTLILNFFKNGKNGPAPRFRSFFQMNDYISQDLTADKVKWKTGSLDYLTNYCYWYKNNGNIVISSVEERKLIIDFINEFKEKNGIEKSKYGFSAGDIDMEVENGIFDYQNTIKKRRLAEKHEKLKREIDSEMEKFGGLPEDYDEFIAKTVFSDEHYIFYSRKNGTAYCTSCGKDFSVAPEGYFEYNGVLEKKPGHNKTAECPCCHKYIVCKSNGMGRRKLFSVRWSVLVQKYNGEVIVRYFRHTKDFRNDYRRPEICMKELYRTVHRENKCKEYMWDAFKGTEEYRWCEYREKSCFWNGPGEMTVPKSVALYRSGLEESISGTCMKYSAADIFIDKIADKYGNNGFYMKNPWCVDWYFNAYREKPYIEQLLKIGFYKLVKEILGKHSLNLPEFTYENSVVKTLGIDRVKFKMLAGAGDPSLTDLKILRYADRIREEDFIRLKHMCAVWDGDLYEKYMDLMRFTSLYKIEKYFLRNNFDSNKARDYFDYISWIGELGYDMRNEFNLYPKDFIKSHDEKMKEYEILRDKRKQEERRRMNRIIERMKTDGENMPVFNMSFKGMFVRLPRNSEELKREGEQLHHCVGSYAEKVAEGKTIILFIRKEDNPDKPYFTMEWQGKVIQCRGNNNCSMTKNVKEFTEVFSKEMLAAEDK